MKNTEYFNFVERVKQANDIVSTVGRYISLTRKGSQFWACCPFHYEKTPSFALNEREQYWHCFGCGETGDVVKFVQKFENVDFHQAVEILAKNAGIDMPNVLVDENIAKLKKQKELIYKINLESAKFYNRVLFSPSGKEALNYLLERGMDRSTIIKFGLGLSPDWTSVLRHLRTCGFKDDEIIMAGIADRKNNRTFDFFAERIVYPILNSYGDVVGFSGRTMKKDKSIAKYKNTRETPAFDKSRSVFAINLIKKHKNEKGLTDIIIAEGQMDVMALHQAGFTNAVACMGTALTFAHARELKRFVEKVYVCFDGDSAGQKATLKSLDILANAGLYVSVVSLPEGLDPDEFIKKYGVDAFKEQLNLAKPVVDYKLEVLAKKFDLENNYERSKFIKEAIEILKNEPSEIDAEVYLKTIAGLTHVPVDLLRRELNALPTKQPAEVVKTEELGRIDNAYSSACKFVLASLLFKREGAKIPESDDFYFMDNDLNALFHHIKRGIIVSSVFDLFDVENSVQIKEIVNFEFHFKSTAEEQKYFSECVLHIIKCNINKQIDDNNKKLKEAVSNEERIAILTQIQNLTTKLLTLKGDING